MNAIEMNKNAFSDELAAMRQRISELEALQRKTRQAQQTSELYRVLIEEGLGLICAHDLNGVLLMISPAAAHSLGYPPGTGIGRSLREFLAPRVQDQFEAYLDRIRKNASDSGLMRLVAKDGSERIWFYRNVKYEEPGMPPRVLGHAQDVTGRIRAEQALKESEWRFRAMADSAPVMIWMSGPNGDCTFFNKPWLDFTGRRMEQEIGEGWSEGVHPEDLERCFSTYMSSLQARINFRMEYRLRRADGQFRWVLDTGVPSFSGSGAFAGYIGSCIDIHEAKQDREALEKAHDELAARVAERTADLQRTNEQLRLEISKRRQVEGQLRRSNEDLQQFAFTISHDLQEPLLAARIFATLVAKQYRGKIDPQADEYISRIGESINLMTGMIQDLLGYSRSPDDKRNFKSIDMEAVLRWAKMNLETTIQESSAVLTHDSLPTIRGNFGRLVQVFQNLIGNAIKYRGHQVAHIHISAQENAREWIFSVRDNGIGIDPKNASRIFAIFERVEQSKMPGTGGGLAICSKIVERHGGRIWVESKIGEGSAFFFSIPR